MLIYRLLETQYSYGNPGDGYFETVASASINCTAVVSQYMWHILTRHSTVVCRESATVAIVIELREMHADVLHMHHRYQCALHIAEMLRVMNK